MIAPATALLPVLEKAQNLQGIDRQHSGTNSSCVHAHAYAYAGADAQHCTEVAA